MSEELNYWRESVSDYLVNRDWNNLYIAAEKLNKLDPSDPLGLAGMARAQQQRGEYEMAYFNISQARRRSGDISGPAAEAMLELEAELAEHVGQLDTAIARYTELKNLNPLEPRYASALAQALARAGRTEEAQNEARKGAEFFGAEGGMSSVHRDIVSGSLQQALDQARSLGTYYRGQTVYTSKNNAEAALSVLTGASTSLFEASPTQQAEYSQLVAAAESSMKRRFSWIKHPAAVLYAIFAIPFLFAPLSLPGSLVADYYKTHGQGASGALMQGIYGFFIGVALAYGTVWVFYKFFYVPGYVANERAVAQDGGIAALNVEKPEKKGGIARGAARSAARYLAKKL